MFFADVEYFEELIDYLDFSEVLMCMLLVLLFECSSVHIWAKGREWDGLPCMFWLYLFNLRGTSTMQRCSVVL